MSSPFWFQNLLSLSLFFSLSLSLGEYLGFNHFYFFFTFLGCQYCFSLDTYVLYVVEKKYLAVVGGAAAQHHHGRGDTGRRRRGGGGGGGIDGNTLLLFQRNAVFVRRKGRVFLPRFKITVTTITIITTSRKCSICLLP